MAQITAVATVSVFRNRGRIAFQRGPVVYCMEQAGNDGLSYDDFELGAHGAFAVEHRGELLGGVTVLQGQTAEGVPCELIPYYAWDNREAGFMQVWIREAEDRRLYLF